MKKRISVVIPPFLSQLQREIFVVLVSREFEGQSMPCSFVSHLEFCLLSLDSTTLQDFDIGDSVIFCNMEEEISVRREFVLFDRTLTLDPQTISYFQITTALSRPSIGLKSLNAFQFPLLPLGTYDVADQFQEYLEQRIFKSSQVDVDTFLKEASNVS